MCSDVLPAGMHVRMRVCMCVREGGREYSLQAHMCMCVWFCSCVCVGGVELFLLKCVQFYHYCEFAAKKGTRDQKSQNMGRSSQPSEKIHSSRVTNTRQARTGFELCEPGSWREQRIGWTLHRCFRVLLDKAVY